MAGAVQLVSLVHCWDTPEGGCHGDLADSAVSCDDDVGLNVLGCPADILGTTVSCWDAPVSSAGAATSIIFVATKHVPCRDKSMLAATKHLLRPTYFCRDKTFVTTNICRDKHVCREKHTFVATEDVFYLKHVSVCRDTGGQSTICQTCRWSP